MNMTAKAAATKAAGRRLTHLNSDRSVLLLYAGALFLSAVLLFSVQPIFAKLVLPTLGGSPSVWAVAMCFFQAALLAGYCYAHLLIRYLRPAHAPLCHMAVLAAAILALPFGLPDGIGAPPAEGAYLWLIGVLALGVGLPFFAVSANAPLLQAWFARTGHRDAADPYYLYGASNLGSLLALLAYPVLLEPMLGLGEQARIWSQGFALMAALIMLAGAQMLSRRRAHVAKATKPTALAAPVAWTDRLWWVALAMVPSGLMVAYTTHVTTDLASAPFLWVIPLAVFLATFIIVFRDRPLIPERWTSVAQPILVAIAAIGLIMPGVSDAAWALHLAVGFLAFATTTLVCHRTLYLRRPDSARLTEFYLWMSLGGVLGGVFAGLLAPQIFTGVQEYPLLLTAGLLLRPGVLDGLRKGAEDRSPALRLGGLLCLAAAAIYAAFAMGLMTVPLAERMTAAVVLVAGLAMLAHLRQPARMAGAAVAMALALVAVAPNLAVGFSVRSFFGVHRVLDTPDGRFRLLAHGTTVHGAQRLQTDAGAPVERPDPATYYFPGGPMNRALESARAAIPRENLAVGVVGLGAGSLTCYARPGESWRYFEIDPTVVGIARDPALFDFMARCGPETPVTLGDARLTVAEAPRGAFDFLLIDAFSSDVVPAHLLTREALLMYLDRLGPDGLLALHISNRHMDLQSVLAATAATLPGAHAYVISDRMGLGGLDGMRSQVFFIARDAATLDPVRAWPDAHPAKPAGARPWTDDYSNVLGAIWMKYAR